MQTQTAHKRKHSADLGSSGKSPKRGRFSSLFGLNIFEYENVEQSTTSLTYRIPKAPPTCTVSLETAGVLEDNACLTSASTTETSCVSISPTPSPPQPCATAARFRCSPSSSQSFFKGHHRSNSSSVLQDERERIQISVTNLRKRGDVKLVAMVRRSVVAGNCVDGSQDVLLAQRLTGYLDLWGWREREREPEDFEVGSVFDMEVDDGEIQVGMDVDSDVKPPAKFITPSSPRHTNHSSTLSLDQVVATLTLKHRERSSVAGRSKERDTKVSRTTRKSCSNLRWELGQD